MKSYTFASTIDTLNLSRVSKENQGKVFIIDDIVFIPNKLVKAHTLFPIGTRGALCVTEHGHKWCLPVDNGRGKFTIKIMQSITVPPKYEEEGAQLLEKHYAFKFSCRIETVIEQVEAIKKMVDLKKVKVTIL